MKISISELMLSGIESEMSISLENIHMHVFIVVVSIVGERNDGQKENGLNNDTQPSVGSSSTR